MSRYLLFLPAVATITTTACSQGSEALAEPAEEAVTIPDSLAPFGDGYPQAGDPCRRLGESPATSDWLDHDAILVGCPSAAAAAELGGTIVAQSDGVTIKSIPLGQREASGAPPSSSDALVEGTDYNATTRLRCGFDGAAPTGLCEAGVKRQWGEDGTTLVEIRKPDGFTRAIFVRGTEPYGADSAEADGSAGWDFETTREGDEVTVRFGPETYVLVDAFLEGG